MAATKSSWAVRFSALLITMALIFALIPSYAFAADTTGRITIVKPDTITTAWNTMQVNAYMVLQQTNPIEEDPIRKTYKVTEDFKPLFDTPEVEKHFGDAPRGPVYLTYDATSQKIVAQDQQPDMTTPSIKIEDDSALDSQFPTEDLLSRIQNGNAQDNTGMIVLYDWIEQYIQAKGILANRTETAGTANSIDLNGLTPGGYALLFSHVPEGIVVNQGIIVASSSGNQAPITVALKAQDLPLDKEVANHTQNTGFNSAVSAQVGDILDYHITTKLPNPTANSQFVTFKLEDKLVNQSVVDNSFQLTVGGTPLTFDSTTNQFTTVGGGTIVATLTIHHSAGTNGDTDSSFVLDFNKGILTNTNWVGDAVELHYQAELGADAVKQNDNTVKLTYENGPTEHTDQITTHVYTYGVNLNKTFEGDPAIIHTYESVQFALYASEADAGQIDKALLFTKQADGSYKLDPNGDQNLLTPNVTTGLLRLEGLGADTYILEERATKTGYITSGNVRIALVDEGALANGVANGRLDQTSKAELIDAPDIDLNNVVDNNGDLAVLAFGLINQKGFELPRTGGEGTWMYTLGGVALIGVAGLLMVLNNKKKKSH